MRGVAPALLIGAAFGCSSDLSIALIELPLAPEDVTSIVIWVTDTERGEIVASATVAPPATGVALGVPAERPLEFSVLARTAQPGPEALGGRMPGWVGRAVKRIPLGREQVVLPIVAHPAGALTLIPKLSPELGGRVRIRLGAETGDSPRELELSSGIPLVLALRAGRYRVTVAEEDEDEAMIVAGDGIFVERRIESVGVVELERRAPSLPPEAVRRIQVVLTDEEGDPIELPVATSTAPAVVRVLVEAFNASGTPAGSEADVQIDIAAVPASTVRIRRLTAARLPSLSPRFEIGGTGRVAISARAAIQDEPGRSRTLEHDLRTNALGPGVEPGPPIRLELDLLGNRQTLVRGTRISAELIDARGLFAAEATGTVDFRASDPWLFFPRGPTAELTPSDRGHLIREVARPSGPRGLFVVLRAAYTSTAVPGTLTSSVTLPVLESSE